MSTSWRREWDSNPRYGFPHTRFPSVRLKPLGHLSGCLLLKGRADFCKGLRKPAHYFVNELIFIGNFPLPAFRRTFPAKSVNRNRGVETIEWNDNAVSEAA